MTTLESWFTIAGLAVVTLVTRAAYLLIPERYGLPGWLERALRYAPACALVAIIVPDLGFGRPGEPPVALPPQFLGMLAGVGLFLGTRSMLLTIAGGMLVFTLSR